MHETTIKACGSESHCEESTQIKCTANQNLHNKLCSVCTSEQHYVQYTPVYHVLALPELAVFQLLSWIACYKVATCLNTVKPQYSALSII